MSQQVDQLADSPCVYGEAGERMCKPMRPFCPTWCCLHGEGTPVEDTGMST
jgi:hypothetical protein